MTLATLSLEQAPPITVPFRFFLTAPLFLLLAAIAWLLADSSALASRWSPAVLGITHLLTLGFMAMVMCGAMLQLLPVLAGAPVPNPRLVAWAIHLPLLVGALLLAGGLYFTVTPALALGAGLLALALLTFLLAALYSLLRAPARNASTHAMLLALLALALTLTLGLLLAAGVGGWLGVPLLELTRLHVAWGLLGWTMLLLIGVAYQVVPMFQLTPPYPRWATRWLGGGLFASLLLWSLSQLAAWPRALELAAGLLVALGLAVFGVLTLHLQRQRRRRVADITLQFWQAGMASLLLAIVLWLCAQASDAVAHSNAYALALGMLLILGLALSVIMGMLYKIAPFLIWFHLQGNAPGKRVPHMKEIVHDDGARWHLRAHLACLPLFLLSAVWPWPWMYAAGSAMLLSGALLLRNLQRAWRLYLATLRTS
ncbi:MAG TPA: hypothetical protein VFR06_10380 [Gallionellaceae bacterium]|nr:hypothetical protein [Gallionellaceae bacterium]